MQTLLSSKDKAKAKKYFPKFQSILMQVAKSGIINKKQLHEKFLGHRKKFNSFNQLKVDYSK